MSSKPVSLNLTAEAIAFLDDEAARQGRSRSGLANRIILHAALTGDTGTTDRATPARGTDLAGVKPDPKP